ncbi:MAG: septal ring lytic transglycosylase RlpA family protein [Ignavibacteriaceae bacterium]|nr:septal ring lytic transglycosylase RlpA family protein [Ignavibacteriaceae bacterium]
MKSIYSFTICIVLFAVGCAESPKFITQGNRIKKEKTPSRQSIPKDKYDSVYVYDILPGRRHSPVLESAEGVASYYADKFNGRITASSDIYYRTGYTGAHTKYPLGTIVRVTNLKNNNSVIIKLNDRKPDTNGRVIDLSYKAAADIEMLHDGLAKVLIEVLEWGDGKKAK